MPAEPERVDAAEVCDQCQLNSGPFERLHRLLGLSTLSAVISPGSPERVGTLGFFSKDYSIGSL